MSTTFTLDADTIITHSMRLAGVLSPALSASSTDKTTGRELLNAHLKTLEEVPQLSAMLGQWELTVSVSANDTYAAVSNDVESVFSAYYKQTSNSNIIKLIPVTQREMFELRAVSSIAAATDKIYYCVSKRSSGTHPVNGAVTTRVMYFYGAIPAAGTVFYVPKNKLDIFDNGADTGDLPAPFYNYLIYTMAVTLGLYHGAPVERIQVLMKLKEDTYAVLMNKQTKDFASLETDSKTSITEKKR